MQFDLPRGFVVYFRKCLHTRPRKKQAWVQQKKKMVLALAAALLLLFLRQHLWSSAPMSSPLHQKLHLLPVKSGSKAAFLLSAFYDARPLVLLSSPRVVILSVVDMVHLRLLYTTPPRHALQCLLRNDHQVWQLDARLTVLAESNRKKMRPCFIKCTITANIAEEILSKKGGTPAPMTVAVSMLENSTVIATSLLVDVEYMPLAPFPPHVPSAPRDHVSPYSGPIGICVAPMRGDIYADEMHHFFRHYMTLAGSDYRFLLYNHSAGPAMSKAIIASINAGKNVHVLQWALENGRFPETLGLSASTFYYGQMLAINDCLLRMVGHVRWVGYVDLDEYIVPRLAGLTSLTDVFAAAHPRGPEVPASFMFLNAIFHEECATPMAKRVEVSPPDRALYRSPAFFPPRKRSKIFSNPLAVSEQGIHWVRTYLDSEKLEMDISRVMESLWDWKRPLKSSYMEHIQLLKRSMTRVNVLVEPNISAIHHVKHVIFDERGLKDCSSQPAVFTFDDAALMAHQHNH
jgi:hypothetical protein